MSCCGKIIPMGHEFFIADSGTDIIWIWERKCNWNLVMPGIKEKNISRTDWDFLKRGQYRKQFWTTIHPKDRLNVEGFISKIFTWITAPLRIERFSFLQNN